MLKVITINKRYEESLLNMHGTSVMYVFVIENEQFSKICIVSTILEI